MRSEVSWIFFFLFGNQRAVEELGGCVYLEVNLSQGGDAMQLCFMRQLLVCFGWF